MIRKYKNKEAIFLGEVDHVKYILLMKNKKQPTLEGYSSEITIYTCQRIFENDSIAFLA